jgi:hypothetical protein
MVVRTLIGAVALVLVTATSAGAADASRCALRGKEFTGAVKPLYNYEDAGYTAFRQFIGAEVFVPAQPGLTAEWLDRVLTSQIAGGTCQFGAPKVDVQVLSDGGGFSVRLSGTDEKSAAAILRHAQQMLK